MPVFNVMFMIVVPYVCAYHCIDSTPLNEQETNWYLSTNCACLTNSSTHWFARVIPMLMLHAPFSI